MARHPNPPKASKSPCGSYNHDHEVFFLPLFIVGYLPRVGWEALKLLQVSFSPANSPGTSPRRPGRQVRQPSPSARLEPSDESAGWSQGEALPANVTVFFLQVTSGADSI